MVYSINIDVFVKNSYNRDERIILATDNYQQFVAKGIQEVFKEYKVSVDTAAIVIEIPYEATIKEDILAKIIDEVGVAIETKFSTLHEEIPVLVKMPFMNVGDFIICAF